MVELGFAGLNLVRLGLGLGLWETTGLVMHWLYTNAGANTQGEIVMFISM